MAFFMISTSIASIGVVYGQGINGISASTSRASYQPGDKVVITGSVQRIVDSNPVTIIVRNPIGNVYEIGQVNVLNNLFVHDFVLSDTSQNGTYTVNMKYGNQTGQIQFMVKVGQLQIISVYNNWSIKVRGENTTQIKYGNVEISTVDNSISVSLDTSKISNGHITEEYQIPKQVIDAPGSQLAVKEDGIQIECTQTETDVQRIIDCPIVAGAKQLVFIGTIVIPEFGPMAMVILTISVMASVVVFSRHKMQKIS
jgi:predicted secreted protein with PEFG-CTERM motif